MHTDTQAGVTVQPARQINPVDVLAMERTANVRYLYIIHELGEYDWCKVGRAAHPIDRLSDMQCGNRRKLSLFAAWSMPNGLDKRLEAQVHGLMCFKRGRGEWFNLSPNDAQSIIAGQLEEWGV